MSNAISKTESEGLRDDINHDDNSSENNFIDRIPSDNLILLDRDEDLEEKEHEICNSFWGTF